MLPQFLLSFLSFSLFLLAEEFFVLNYLHPHETLEKNEQEICFYFVLEESKLELYGYQQDLRLNLGRLSCLKFEENIKFHIHFTRLLVRVL